MGCNCSKRKTQENESSKYNLVDVIKDTITGNTSYASEEVKNKRILICKRCPQLMTAPLNITGTGNCKKCGCFVDFKVMYEKSQCPMFKW
jgi:hypothetical protein